ncbi:MAG: sulfite exporter TauE/SafE family protein [Reyranella sp.]|nr:sulfite exporter TauE/SafE family protein [Reyranella sp.]
MTLVMAAGLSLLMVGTAFLSGIFGMAGGLILIGVLLFIFPLPAAMVLHAVTQMASNGWRALLWWRHIVWKSTAFYVAGCLVAVGLWSITLYVPDKATALLMLGLSPFIIRAIPERVLPRNFGPLQVAATGLCSMALMLLTGVTGPLLDTMFLRSPLDRRAIIATKASCQVFGHGFKLVYFGALIAEAGRVEPWFLGVAIASSMIGTSLGKLLLEKLTDKQFRVWSNRLITALAAWYVGYGLVLLTGIA